METDKISVYGFTQKIFNLQSILVYKSFKQVDIW